jgi:hypothetical protein
MKELGREFKMIFFPKGKTEKWLLFILWGTYFSYSAFIAFNTYVIDHPTIPYDIYFGFDNQSILKNGVQNYTGHPMMKFYLLPFMSLSNGVAWLLGYKAKTLFVVFLCSGLISYSALYIFRYLKEIIKLETQISILLTGFYAIFSTCLTLAFTPESFTISAFLLTLSLWYLSSFITAKEEMPFLPYFFLTFIIAGITITNSLKTLFIPIFDNIKWKVKFWSILVTFFCVGSMVIKVNMRHHIVSDAQSRLEIFSDHSNELFPIIQKALSHFFGAPVLFPSFEYKIDNSFNNHIITTALYDQPWQYLFSIIIITAGIYALIKHFRNPLVQILAMFFAVDFGIHILIRFGLDDAFLYGGHWVFLIPLLLGWLYQSLQTNLSKKIFTATLLAFIVLLLINNGYRLTEFYHFASTYYHV